MNIYLTNKHFCSQNILHEKGKVYIRAETSLQKDFECRLKQFFVTNKVLTVEQGMYTHNKMLKHFTQE